MLCAWSLQRNIEFRGITCTRRDSHNQNLICSLFCVFSLSFLGYLRSDLIQTPQRVTLNYFESTTGDFSRLWIRALVRINYSVLYKKQGHKQKIEISRKVRWFFISFCQLLGSRGWTERSPFLFLPCSILFVLWSWEQFIHSVNL